jgi:hypothetical protein
MKTTKTRLRELEYAFKDFVWEHNNLPKFKEGDIIDYSDSSTEEVYQEAVVHSIKGIEKFNNPYHYWMPVRIYYCIVGNSIKELEENSMYFHISQKKN